MSSGRPPKGELRSSISRRCREPCAFADVLVQDGLQRRAASPSLKSIDRPRPAPLAVRRYCTGRRTVDEADKTLLGFRPFDMSNGNGGWMFSAPESQDAYVTMTMACFYSAPLDWNPTAVDR